MKLATIVIARALGLVAVIWLASVVGYGQTSTTTLAWDYAKPLAEVQGYTQTLTIDGTPQSVPITCVAGTPAASATVCSATVPALASGPRLVTVTAKRNSIERATTSTLDVSQGPAGATGVRIVITVTVTVP